MTGIWDSEGSPSEMRISLQSVLALAGAKTLGTGLPAGLSPHPCKGPRGPRQTRSSPPARVCTCARVRARLRLTHRWYLLRLAAGDSRGQKDEGEATLAQHPAGGRRSVSGLAQRQPEGSPGWGEGRAPAAA